MKTETKELHSFLWNAAGISRLALNIFCLLGAFLGIGLYPAFQRLNRSNIGLLYFFSYALISFIAFVARFGAANFQVARLLSFICLIIWVVGWIHANFVLSKYMRLGKDRIKEINELPQDELNMNLYIEKGLIFTKVLSDKYKSFEEFKLALQFSGGEGYVLSFAADNILYDKNYALAKQYFERALTNTENINIIKHINKVLPYIERKLKK